MRNKTVSQYDESNAFTVGLDPSYILVCMEMWRDATDLKIPLRDDFKVHFITRRHTLLANCEKTATAWSMILGSMRAHGNHQMRLDECREKVEEFKSWAKAELAELAQVAAQDQLQDTLQEGLQQLMIDPVAREQIEKLGSLGGSKRPLGGKDNQGG
jgi:hypothetical protein